MYNLNMELLLIIAIVIAILIYKKKKENQGKINCPISFKLFKYNSILHIVLYIIFSSIGALNNKPEHLIEMFSWNIVLFFATYFWSNVLITLPIFLFEYFKKDKKL